MSPRRLQRATILSMVTTSAGMRPESMSPMPTYTAPPYADLRVPLRERPPLRGHAEDDRRAGHPVRGMRRAGAAGVPPGGGPLQGVRLLQHRLRDLQAQTGAREVGLR